MTENYLISYTNHVEAVLVVMIVFSLASTQTDHFRPDLLLTSMPYLATQYNSNFNTTKPDYTFIARCTFASNYVPQ